MFAGNTMSHDGEVVFVTAGAFIRDNTAGCQKYTD